MNFMQVQETFHFNCETDNLKEKATTEAKKEKQSLEAEGYKEAQFREAEARERTAEAEAVATETVSKAIAQGDIQAIHYFVAQKYIDAIAQLAASDNAKTIMMPLEASNVIGSVGGINELLKSLNIKK